MKKYDEETKLTGRKAFLTFNNPSKYGYNTENPEDMKPTYFNRALERWGNSILFMCCTKEIGAETHTKHDHLYIHFKNAVNRSSIQKTFPHCDIRYHTESDEENRNYIYKIGKQKGTEKEDTRIDGYQFEWGKMDSQGKRTDLELLRDSILSGKTNGELYKMNAEFMKFSGCIDKIRSDLQSDEYSGMRRKLKVIYQCGATGTGKTRSVLDTYGDKNVFRITDLQHPFDGYNGQKIIVFEEFRSGFRIEDMLKYLDIYPIELPARYANKQACYDTVYLNSNWDLKEQYKNIQEEHSEDWQAFLRRIDEVHAFEAGKVYVYKQVKLKNGTYDFISDEGVSYFHRFEK